MLLVTFLAALSVAHGLDSRIVGGTTTTIGQRPYQVSVILDGTHYCGGSIIDKQWILTAAHCVYGIKASRLKVRVGSTYSVKDGTIYSASSVICHEFYDEDNYDYDIALLKLTSSIKLSTTAKIVKLATASTDPPAGSKAIVAGWGFTSPGGAMSENLMVLEVPIIDRKSCEKIYAPFNPLTTRMLCAGYMTGNKDTCQGDSGGPLVHGSVQIGIVSWGAECARAGFPGVYTRLSALRSWITKRANI